MIRVYCEKCEYAIEEENIDDAIVKVAFSGGYIQSDLKSGYYTECPKCENDSLIIEN